MGESEILVDPNPISGEFLIGKGGFVSRFPEATLYEMIVLYPNKDQLLNNHPDNGGIYFPAFFSEMQEADDPEQCHYDSSMKLTKDDSGPDAPMLWHNAVAFYLYLDANPELLSMPMPQFHQKVDHIWGMLEDQAWRDNPGDAVSAPHKISGGVGVDPDKILEAENKGFDGGPGEGYYDPSLKWLQLAGLVADAYGRYYNDHPPELKEIIPDHGPHEGGTTVKIRGEHIYWEGLQNPEQPIEVVFTYHDPEWLYPENATGLIAQPQSVFGTLHLSNQYGYYIEVVTPPHAADSGGQQSISESFPSERAELGPNNATHYRVHVEIKVPDRDPVVFHEAFLYAPEVVEEIDGTGVGDVNLGDTYDVYVTPFVQEIVVEVLENALPGLGGGLAIVQGVQQTIDLFTDNHTEFEQVCAMTYAETAWVFDALILNPPSEQEANYLAPERFSSGEAYRQHLESQLNDQGVSILTQGQIDNKVRELYEFDPPRWHKVSADTINKIEAAYQKAFEESNGVVDRSVFQQAARKPNGIAVLLNPLQFFRHRWVENGQRLVEASGLGALEVVFTSSVAATLPAPTHTE